jgi:hypothetical protein
VSSRSAQQISILLEDIFGQSFVVMIWFGEDEMSATGLSFLVETSFESQFLVPVEGKRWKQLWESNCRHRNLITAMTSWRTFQYLGLYALTTSCGMAQMMME